MFQHQVVSGLFWWVGRYLGWVGHFCVLQLLKWQQTGPGTREKAPLFCALVVIRKKRPFCRSQDLPPRTSSAMFYQASNHNALLPSLQGPGLQTLQPFSNISLTLSYTALHVCEPAVNISSHCIIHLMQYLIHVHGVTNVSSILTPCNWLYIDISDVVIPYCNNFVIFFGVPQPISGTRIHFHLKKQQKLRLISDEHYVQQPSIIYLSTTLTITQYLQFMCIGGADFFLGALITTVFCRLDFWRWNIHLYEYMKTFILHLFI